MVAAAIKAYGRVVDQPIDAAIGLDGSGDHRIGGLDVADIDLDRDRVAAGGFHRVEGLTAIVDVGCDHFCAGIGAGPRIFLTDAPRGPGYDYDLTVQHHPILPSGFSVEWFSPLA